VANCAHIAHILVSRLQMRSNRVQRHARRAHHASCRALRRCLCPAERHTFLVAHRLDRVMSAFTPSSPVHALWRPCGLKRSRRPLRAFSAPQVATFLAASARATGFAPSWPLPAPYHCFSVMRTLSGCPRLSVGGLPRCHEHGCHRHVLEKIHPATAIQRSPVFTNPIL
jgi:hypothetical protein